MILKELRIGDYWETIFSLSIQKKWSWFLLYKIFLVFTIYIVYVNYKFTKYVMDN